MSDEQVKQSERTKRTSEWQTEDTFAVGAMCGEITSAPGERGGKRYSWVIGKSMPNRKDPKLPFISRFCGPADFKAAHDVLTQMENWIDCDREENKVKEKRA